MLVLKGDCYKSVTIEKLLKNSESYCYLYYSEEIPIDFNYNFVNSNMASLIQLRGYITEYIHNNSQYRHIEYFIVYTNKTEDELSGFIEWLGKHEKDFNCNCVIVTCK